jgi:DNA-binding GntR family transcriptional regulator
MRDDVRDLIVSRILRGDYAAGTRLKELDLARECNVSQAPVREALRELEALGLLVSERYRGTRVRAADAAELRQAYELRMLLEERSAQLAVPCAPGMLALLEAEIRNLRGAVKRRDMDSYADAAIRFHRKLVEASGNRAFLGAWDSLHWEVRTRIAVQRALRADVDLNPYVDAHASILDALRAGDGIAAGRRIRALIDRLIKVVEPGGNGRCVVIARSVAPRKAQKRRPKRA